MRHWWTWLIKYFRFPILPSPTSINQRVATKVQNSWKSFYQALNQHYCTSICLVMNIGGKNRIGTIMVIMVQSQKIRMTMAKSQKIKMKVKNQKKCTSLNF